MYEYLYPNWIINSISNLYGSARLSVEEPAFFHLFSDYYIYP